MLDEITGGAGTAVADGAAADTGTGGSDGTGTEVTPTDTGAGDGAGGDGPGTGDGADGGAGDTEGDTAEGTEGAADGESTGEGEDEFSDADGRKVDVKTREALAALKKTNPNAAKALADTYHRAQAIVKDIGAQNLSDAVNKVRQMAATMEAVGGEEGLTNLQGEVEDYRTEIKQFSEGDPALLTQLHEANADSFGLSIANGLELLADKSPAIFEKALLPSLVGRLEKAGMYNSVKTLAALIKDGKGQEAYDLTSQISEWLDKAKGMASKQIEMKSKKDPEREALDRDKADFATQKQQKFEEDIATNVNRQNNGATSKVVEPFFKDLKLKPEGRREFINALNNRIWAAMKADTPFQRAAHNIMKKGDAVRTARFTSAKFAELLPDHFRKLRDAMYPNFTKGGTKVTTTAKPAAAAGTKTNGAGGAPAVKVNYTGGKPNRDDVDWAKTSDTLWIAGQAFLKNGKHVKFDWKTVK